MPKLGAAYDIIFLNGPLNECIQDRFYKKSKPEEKLVIWWLGIYNIYTKPDRFN